MILKKKDQGNYGGMGSRFDELFDNVDRLTRLEALSLDGILRPNSVKTILDCACGTGIQAIGLAQKGYKVSASDISRKMVRILKRKATNKGLKI